MCYANKYEVGPRDVDWKITERQAKNGSAAGLYPADIEIAIFTTINPETPINKNILLPHPIRNSQGRILRSANTA